MKAGDSFTQNFQVTENIYRGFIDIFKDNNPLHVNDTFARSKGFASEVMHGNILNGFISYFIGECLPDKNVIIHSQEIKFSLPLYLNEKLTFHAKIEEVYESMNTLVFRFHFENTLGKKVAKGKIQIGLI